MNGWVNKHLLFNNSNYVLGSYYVPGTVIAALHTVTHLMYPINLWDSITITLIN